MWNLSDKLTECYVKNNDVPKEKLKYTGMDLGL